MTIFSNSKAAKRPLKVLFVASEAAPYIKVGGLGEVMRSLPIALRSIGHDVRVFMPKYAGIDTSQYHLDLEMQDVRGALPEKDPYGLFVCNVLSHRDEKGNVMTYFLENMEYYEKRANVYGYNDDTARWLLLSRGVIEFVKRSEWKPDIIVANDWQTGFIPNIIKVECKDDPVLSKIVTVFTIHNLRYQGLFNPFFINEIDYDSGQGPIPDFLDENIWKLNGIRRGILYADAVSTVSPTYSKEILDPKFGEKLEEVLQQKRARLFGILNGIDYDFFNPANDNQIASPFSEDSLKERSLNKTALQKKVGLPENADKFVMSFVGRLDEQKGIALLRSISDALFENLNFDLIILGTGDNDYKFYFQELQKKYPDRVSVCLYFDPDLPKLIFAGSDAVLVPSLFEPSGLVQMEAMRYGCIPIVRKVGGLADSVKDYSPDKEEGTGFVFEKYDQLAFLIAIVRAMEAYRNKKEWTKLIKRAMTEDFSWAKSAKEYLKLFETAIKFHE